MVKNLKTKAYLALLMGIATMIFVLLYAPLSLRLDESQSLWQTSHSIQGLLDMLSRNVHVPLYHLLLHEWQSFFGNSVFIARSLSLLFFLASIPIIYSFTSRLYGNATGLSAATLLTISPFMNWFGSEARMYTLLVLLVIWSHHAYTTMLKKPNIRTWLPYLAVSVIGIYTHYFFGLILLTQALFYVATRKNHAPQVFWGLMYTLLGVCAALAPWIYLVMNSGSVGESAPFLSRPTSIDFFNVFSNFYFGFQTDYVNSLILSLWPLVVLMSFFALGNQTKKPDSHTWYLFLSVSIPLFVALLISFFFQPVFLSRYLVVALPGLIILTSRIIMLYPLRIRTITHVALVSLMITGLVLQAFDTSIPVREDYHYISTHLSKRVSPQDIIIVSVPFTIYPINYYYSGSARITTIPEWNRYGGEALPPFRTEDLETIVEDISETYQKVWLILSYDQGYEREVRQAFDNRYLRLEDQSIGSSISLYVYKTRHDTDYKENYLHRGLTQQ